jgi:hypothetical protein
MRAALKISDSLAEVHAQRLQGSLMEEREASKAALPVMLHVQMTVEAAIQAAVPGHGHLSVQVRGANMGITTYPVPPAASGATRVAMVGDELKARLARRLRDLDAQDSKPRLVKSVCVCFDHVEVQLVKHLLHGGMYVCTSIIITA